MSTQPFPAGTLAKRPWTYYRPGIVSVTGYTVTSFTNLTCTFDFSPQSPKTDFFFFLTTKCVVEQHPCSYIISQPVLSCVPGFSACHSSSLLHAHLLFLSSLCFCPPTISLLLAFCPHELFSHPFQFPSVSPLLCSSMPFSSYGFQLLSFSAAKPKSLFFDRYLMTLNKL